MKDLRKLPYHDFWDEKRYFPYRMDRRKVGFFEFTLKTGRKAFITAENHDGWEHVSIATILTCPTWKEMCEIKDFFWKPEEVVIQFHPKKSEYVNICETSLHLWRPTEQFFPCPPKEKYFPHETDGSKVSFSEFKLKRSGRKAFITTENHDGWKHVSIATILTPPSWEEMCEVKDLFWEPEEVVVQFHPKKSEDVNTCETCLHLWRPTEQFFPRPPKELLK